MAPRNSSTKFFKSEKNNYNSNGDSRLMSSAYDQSSPYSQTAYVMPTTRVRRTAGTALMNPMYQTLQNIGDTEVTRPDGSRVLSLTRTSGKNKENLAQRFRDLLMEAYTKPKRSYETQARMNIMAKPKTAAEYQRLSDAITFMGNMMGDNNRGYLQGKASPPIKPGPTRGSSAMKRMSKADEERWSPGRSGKKKSVGFLTNMGNVVPNYKIRYPVKNDRFDIRDERGRAENFNAQDWANAAGLMEYINTLQGGGKSFEQDNESLGNYQYGNPSILNGMREISYPEYQNKKLPQGLVRGRTFYGLPGGRSGRGVGTAKRYSK